MFAKRGISGSVIAAIVVVIVVIAGVGAYYLVTQPSSVTTSSPSQTSATSQSSPSSTSSSPSGTTTTTQSTTTPTESTTTPTSSTSTPSTTSTTTSSSTSTTSSSTTTELTTSCSATGTSTATGGPSTTPNLVPLFASFSSLGIHFSGSSGGSGGTSLTSTYTVVYASPTTYKVNVDSNATGTSQNLTAWVLKDGTVVAVAASSGGQGQNLTGAQATGIFYGYTFPFALELQFNSYLGSFTNAAGVHSVGTSTATFGPTTMTVTNYAASKLPLTLSACGYTFVLTAFTMQSGSVQGVPLTLITVFNMQGTSADPSGKQTDVNFSFGITTIKKA